MESVHVYLDEKYADQNAEKKYQVTSLTGAYMTASQVVTFRKRYFSLLRNLLPLPPGKIPPLPKVHACALFPDQSDQVKFRFMEGLVSIVNSMGINVVRIGYLRNDGIEGLFNEINGTLHNGKYANFEKKFLIRWCLSPFLSSNGDYLFNFFMERDGTKLQYHHFQQETNQWLGQFFPREAIVIDYNKVGDISFYAKDLPGGVLPDCMGYLLHLRWRKNRGDRLSPFLLRMVEICNGLKENLVKEDLVAMRKG